MPKKAFYLSTSNIRKGHLFQTARIFNARLDCGVTLSLSLRWDTQLIWTPTTWESLGWGDLS